MPNAFLRERPSFSSSSCLTTAFVADADYFLNGAPGQYMYLETIQEETSDDLRSESDVDSRNSPVGWLATDSEDGSVICNDQLGKIKLETKLNVEFAEIAKFQHPSKF